MGKHTDEFTKEKIIGIYQSGKSLRSIANNVKISYSTVKDIVKKFKVTGSVKRKLGSGRKPLLSSEDRSILCQINYNNPRKNAKELKKDLEECKNVNVSTRTIIRNLAHENLFVSIAKRKPLLSAKNKVSRYELSRKFLGYSDELWKSVIFSDESTFEMFATKKHQVVYRKNGIAFEEKNLVPTLKFGKGKVMVWGCISYNGTGNLIFVDEKINNGVYINILANNLKQSAVKIGLTQYIFNKTGLPATHPRQQEHTSKKMTLNYWNEQLNYRI